MSNISNDIIFPEGGVYHSLITWVGGCVTRPKLSKWVARTIFKNKDEHNIEIDQRGTTHYSDAVDTLLYGVTERKPIVMSAGAVLTS